MGRILNATDPVSDLESCHKHAGCFACCPEHPFGLKLSFERVADVGVRAELVLSELFQGYRGFAHGGIIATMLDAAMTHCLLQHGIPALTASLETRYKHPLLVNETFSLEASIVREHSPLYELQAKIIQCSQLVATAKGRFMLSDKIVTQI
jgi:acyl-coenzyme A thioesterase PaaI-like protein